MREKYSIPEMEIMVLQGNYVVTTSDTYVDDTFGKEGEEEDW